MPLPGLDTWSPYPPALLAEAERRLFADLAVFEGGGTLDAIEAVCGPGHGRALLGLLASLAEQNLLTGAGSGSGAGPRPRWQMQATALGGDRFETENRHGATLLTAEAFALAFEEAPARRRADGR